MHDASVLSCDASPTGHAISVRRLPWHQLDPARTTQFWPSQQNRITGVHLVLKRAHPLVDVLISYLGLRTMRPNQSYRERTHEGYACIERSKTEEIKQRGGICHKGNAR
eukprot:352399-Chlamydomonas_euryale.AAC.7